MNIRQLVLFLVLAVAWSATAREPAVPLPRLVDVGSDKCIPCRQMIPVLAALRTEYAGQLEVVFVDIWKSREAGRPYEVRLIPTQIFYDAAGKELARHEGYWSKEAILARFKELGIEFKEPTVPSDQDTKT